MINQIFFLLISTLALWWTAAALPHKSEWYLGFFQFRGVFWSGDGAKVSARLTDWRLTHYHWSKRAACLNDFVTTKCKIRKALVPEGSEPRMSFGYHRSCWYGSDTDVPPGKCLLFIGFTLNTLCFSISSKVIKVFTNFSTWLDINMVLCSHKSMW